MPTAYPPINRYSTRFELSDFKNSLKSLASAGIAIEGPSQEFERPQPLFDWTGQPVLNRIVRIRQRRVSIDLRHSQTEFTEFYSLGLLIQTSFGTPSDFGAERTKRSGCAWYAASSTTCRRSITAPAWP